MTRHMVAFVAALLVCAPAALAQTPADAPGKNFVHQIYPTRANG